jgi:PAS domain S-box-containing protein
MEQMEVDNLTMLSSPGESQILRGERPIPSQGEFTRRKNWSQSILESVRDVIHVLNKDLRVLYCSPASSEFLGYKPSELTDHLITEFIHVDDIDMFVREFRMSRDTYQTFKLGYRFLRKDGKYTTLETRGQFYKNKFFGNARHIPTDATRTMDTFLDLKMENELLKKKLEALKHREESSSLSSPTDTTGTTTTGDDDDDFEDFDFLVTPNAPSVYTQGVDTSLNMLESVSLFTGLRYDLGERSHGISMGLQDGELTSITPEQLLSQPIIVSSSENIEQRTKVVDSDEPRQGKKVSIL